MTAVDDPVQGVERHVFRERERQRQPARLVARPHLELAVGEPERGAVRGMEREPRDGPRGRERVTAFPSSATSE